MGIKGFWPFAEKNMQKHRKKQLLLKDLKGKTVAIDANGFIYKYLTGNLDKEFNYIN